jgi:hypothetical protein
MFVQPASPGWAGPTYCRHSKIAGDNVQALSEKGKSFGDGAAELSVDGWGVEEGHGRCGGWGWQAILRVAAPCPRTESQAVDTAVDTERRETALLCGFL